MTTTENAYITIRIALLFVALLIAYSIWADRNVKLWELTYVRPVPAGYTEVFMGGEGAMHTRYFRRD